MSWIRFVVGIAMLLVGATAHAAFPEGDPPVMRFTPDIPAFPQAFDVTQSEGSVYIASMDGVLGFDGQRWSLLRLPNEDYVQSVDYDGHGRVYIGGVNAIGYLETEDAAVFHDLTPRVRERIGNAEFGDILDTVATPHGVFFRAGEYLFRYDPANDSMQSWQNPGHPTTIGFAGLARYRDTVVTQFRGDGLRQFHDGQWQPLAPSGVTRDPVVELMELPDGGLLLFEKDGSWREFIDGRVQPYAMPEGVPQTLTCSTATRLHDGTAALACDDGILRLLDTKARRLHSIPISATALTGIRAAEDGGVLVTDNESLYHVPWPPRWSIVGSKDGLGGDVHRLRQWGHRWVALTNNGIYIADGSASERTPAFHAVPWAEGDSWDLLGIDDDTALATVNDKLAVVRSNGTVSPIDGPALDAKLIVRSAHDPSIVYAGGNEGMWILQGHGTSWHVVEARLHQPDAVNFFLEDGDRDLWIGTDRSGVHRLTLSPDHLHVTQDRAFGVADGIRYGTLGEAELFRWKDGGIIATTRTGQYRWDGRRFNADLLDGLSTLNDPNLTLEYYLAPDGDEWADNGRHLYHRERGQPWRNEPMPDAALGWIESFAFDEQGALLLTGASRIARYDARVAAAGANRWQPTIRMHAIVWAGPDAKATQLPLHPDSPPRLLAGDYSLDFQVSLPEFRTERPTSFQDRLQPVEKDFGLWSINPRTGWSQLSPGEYTYVARAIDAEGNISETPPYRFVVLPPWYKRPWAYVLWTILLLSIALAFAVGLSENRTRRLRALTAQLESMVTERTNALAEANARLEQLALLDGLTEVANRRGLDAWLRQAWQRCVDTAQPMAIIVIDVDHFKSINDRLGHVGGDELLKKVSRILTECLRSTDGRVGRYGGDEFVAGVPGADIDLAGDIAETMRRHVEATGLTTISVGVAARMPRIDEPVVNLLNEADAALYKCKQGGRNRVYVECIDIASL